MVIKIYKCVCGCEFENDETHTNDFPVCPKCGYQQTIKELKRVVQKPFSNSDNSVAHRHGDFELISDSLAVPVGQIAEHRQNFPDVEVRPDGRPRFTSIKQYDNYMKKTGFLKQSHGKIVGP
jgi:DNA-directed RNA polymerase subunit RPC12/RpoP